MIGIIEKSICSMLILCTLTLSAQKDTTQFVTTWKTDNPGNTDDSTIMLNHYLGYTYNYDVDWNDDGIFDTIGVTGTTFHTYSSPGTYTIRLRGQYPRLGLFNNREKLQSIDQWGTNVWGEMSSMFIFCTNVVSNATDAPDLSNVTSLYQMFAGATSFNGNLNNWDVSTITNMSKMFANAFSFNSDLDNWDVSSVTDMSVMFGSASSFNGDISTWDVSSVKTTRTMFQGATVFNGNLSNWDVSSDTSMAFMFNAVFNFNSDLSNWDVSSAKNMTAMFQSNIKFNRDISSWNVSSVKNTSFMFGRAFKFNQDLSSWDVDSVVNMESMFYYADDFDQNLDNWDISSVTNMNRMFDSTAISVANYDSILIAWQAKPHQQNVSIGVAKLRYCNGATARYGLVMDGWNFVGDTSICISVGESKINLIKNDEINVFPNPAVGKLKIELNNQTNKDPILIYDLNGKIVKRIINPHKIETINLSGFENGMYIIRYRTQTKKITLLK